MLKSESFDVIIIGFGVSGISLAAQCQSKNLNYLVIEKNPDLGGVWFNTTNKTCLQTHKRFYQFSDFPFRKKTPDHPDKLTILQYLLSYINFKKINIDKRVFFNTSVNEIDFCFENNTWQVKTKDMNNKEVSFKSKYLGFCNGCFSKPKDIKLNSDNGTLNVNTKHINYYEFNKLVNNLQKPQLLEIFKNKKILIHGNGPTACDIVDILKNIPGVKITVSFKSPKFYIKKYLFGISTSYLVNPTILKIVKWYPKWLFYFLFSIIEMLFSFGSRLSVPIEKMNHRNVVAKTNLNNNYKKNINLARYLGDWEINCYDINIWANGSQSTIGDLLNKYKEVDITKNYLFIYNPFIKNAGFIGLSPSYNWLQVSEKQSKIFVENIVKGIYPEKKVMIDWINKRENYCKKIGISFNDLTYDGISFGLT